MGYTYYQLDVYIPKYNNVFSVDVAFEALTERFSHPRYNAKLERVSTNNIEIHFGDWVYHINLGGQPARFVEIPESIEEVKSKRSDWESIVTSDRIVICWGDNDLNMRYFNEYLFVVHVFEAIPDVYLYFPHIGTLWKSGEEPPI